MTVLPCRSPSLRYNLALRELFFQTHRRSLITQTPQILSFSSTLEKTLNLRALLQTRLQAQLYKTQHYCYWENPQQQAAILALGQVVQAQLPSPQRFSRAKQVSQGWFERSHQGGECQQAYAGVHCFLAFTFFGHTTASSSPLFAPATLFIPQLQIVARPHETLWVGNVKIDAESTWEETVAQFETLIAPLENPLSAVLTAPAAIAPVSAALTPTPESYASFTQAVQAVLQDIEQQQLTKLVLAHIIEQHYPQPISVGRTLTHLRQTHPDCYVFAFGNGNGYHFVGASPERLIHIREQLLTTDALAGSAPRGISTQDDRAIAQRLLTSEKENREHQAVSNYILHQLTKLGLTPQRLSRRLRRLTNIQHLWTPITAILPDHFHPLDVVAQLHPTPAVAGIPAAKACAKIQDYEDFDRSLYAAPLGWLTPQGESEFIVGIRSALIRENWVCLYGGAGIVAGSDPERERAEIQLKLQTMGQALE
ncbi:MAG: isochorismate synthase [Spirulina sp. SIO3F2]|nr:isochorismate synthase [Spirulina sp. SIO3F2]